MSRTKFWLGNTNIICPPAVKFKYVESKKTLETAYEMSTMCCVLIAECKHLNPRKKGEEMTHFVPPEHYMYSIKRQLC